ncbi:MAG: FKBP-type peptidyl-prolyl cis-trans isomerase [Tannerella sp.]|uniref:FKBP-type peptidyl-prolyl cis-trans isomerase n=1 Tax=uncultured Coprobacter sp. TaxID=1720550 RepID=UPI00260DBD73|nr:FKBP-type peptidyl-prolyl cis-trans isomerase [uncultured Coprobacter sp.]MBS6269377.1 FKBP-type peptidyl-prolyl cis-trans isomerase [Tannerella sp.]
MKKTVLCSVLAAGLVAMGLTSCNKKSGAALADGVDSLSYAFGVLNGTDLAMGLKQYPKKVDIDQFIRGMQSTVNSDSAKFSYEFGAAIGSNMKQQIEQMGKQGIEMNKEEILSALFATLKEDSTLLSRAQAEEVFRNGMQAIQLKKQKEEAEKLANTPEAKKNKADGEAFLAKKAKEAGVQKTASGLLYKVVKEGKGEKPVENDKVTVSYKGTLIDGTQFDASEKVAMSVGQLVPGFNEALMLMTPGSKYEVYIPAELAYGTNPNPRIPVNSTLIFEIELLSVDK